MRISTRLILISRMNVIIQVHWPQNPTDHPNLPVYLMHLEAVGFDGLEPTEGKAEELEQRIRETVLPHLLQFNATEKAFNNVVLRDDDDDPVPRRSKKGQGLQGSRELKGLLDSSGPNQCKKDI